MSKENKLQIEIVQFDDHLVDLDVTYKGLTIIQAQVSTGFWDALFSGLDALTDRTSGAEAASMDETIERLKGKMNRKQTESVLLTPDYWDCECKDEYIHFESEESCPECKAKREDQPNSRISEVEL